MSTSVKKLRREGNANHKTYSPRFFYEHKNGGNFGALPQKLEGTRRIHTLVSSAKNRKTRILESTAEREYCSDEVQSTLPLNLRRSINVNYEQFIGKLDKAKIEYGLFRFYTAT